MALYEYDCQVCKNKFESVEKMDTEITYCPECGKIAKRNHSPGHISFRLMGCCWARTGYEPAKQFKNIRRIKRGEAPIE